MMRANSVPPILCLALLIINPGSIPALTDKTVINTHHFSGKVENKKMSMATMNMMTR